MQFLFSTQFQEIYCLVDKEGEVLEGGEGTVLLRNFGLVVGH